MKMENQKRVQFEERQTTYNVLADAELQMLFTRLSLFINSCYRNDDYDEKTLNKKLKENFRAFTTELDKTLKNDKNNYQLKRLNSFLKYTLECIAHLDNI